MILTKHVYGYKTTLMFSPSPSLKPHAGLSCFCWVPAFLLSCLNLSFRSFDQVFHFGLCSGPARCTFCFHGRALGDCDRRSGARLCKSCEDRLLHERGSSLDRLGGGPRTGGLGWVSHDWGGDGTALLEEKTRTRKFGHGISLDIQAWRPKTR